MSTLVTKQGTPVAEIDNKGRLTDGIERAAAHLKHRVPLYNEGNRDEPVDLKQILIDTEAA